MSIGAMIGVGYAAVAVVWAIASALLIRFGVVKVDDPVPSLVLSAAWPLGIVAGVLVGIGWAFYRLAGYKR